MKEFIYNQLTNGNEIIGIILAMLYFIIPILIMGLFSWGVVALVDAIKMRKAVKTLRADAGLYEFARERYGRR